MRILGYAPNSGRQIMYVRRQGLGFAVYADDLSRRVGDGRHMELEAGDLVGDGSLAELERMLVPAEQVDREHLESVNERAALIEAREIGSGGPAPRKDRR